VLLRLASPTACPDVRHQPIPRRRVYTAPFGMSAGDVLIGPRKNPERFCSLRERLRNFCCDPFRPVSSFDPLFREKARLKLEQRRGRAVKEADLDADTDARLVATPYRPA